MKETKEEFVIESASRPGKARLCMTLAVATAALLWAGAALPADKGAAPAKEPAAPQAPAKEPAAPQAPAKEPAAPQATAKEPAAEEGAAPGSPEEADWPCSQKFVAQLSPATIWAGPSLDSAFKSWHDNDKLREIITKLSDDTLEEADGVKAINEFAAGAGGGKDKALSELFAGLFETMSNQRVSTQDGIKRFFHRQQGVAAKINKVETGVRELDKNGVKHDSPQYTEAKKQLVWNSRVYDERQKLTPYLCEIPLTIEQRLGTYGRAIQAQMSGKAAQP